VSTFPLNFEEPLKVGFVTGPTRRRKRTTDAQRRLAAQWLARAGREVTPAGVEELAPHVRMTGRPEMPEIQAFARLVRLGQVPTPGAVRGEMVSLAAADARRRALKQAKAAVLDDLEGTGRAVAAYVAAYRERTGAGPSWADLRRHTGWPREITDGLMGKLREAGWLAYDDEPGSLRPGPAAASMAEPGDHPDADPVAVGVDTAR
jgi:hypothetical protein